MFPGRCFQAFDLWFVVDKDVAANKRFIVGQNYFFDPVSAKMLVYPVIFLYNAGVVLREGAGTNKEVMPQNSHFTKSFQSPRYRRQRTDEARTLINGFDEGLQFFGIIIFHLKIPSFL